MKTLMPKQLKNEERKWYLVDASWKNLWRLSTVIAIILKWKNKVSYAPHVDNWDYVVVINSEKVTVTWNKTSDKMYYSHTGYLWWIKQSSFEKLLVKKPTEILRRSISWMLPKNKLRKNMMSRLKLIVWQEHNFTQQLEQITL